MAQIGMSVGQSQLSLQPALHVVVGPTLAHAMPQGHGTVLQVLSVFGTQTPFTHARAAAPMTGQSQVNVHVIAPLVHASFSQASPHAQRLESPLHAVELRGAHVPPTQMGRSCGQLQLSEQGT